MDINGSRTGPGEAVHTVEAASDARDIRDIESDGADAHGAVPDLEYEAGHTTGHVEPASSHADGQAAGLTDVAGTLPKLPHVSASVEQLFAWAMHDDARLRCLEMLTRDELLSVCYVSGISEDRHVDALQQMLAIRRIAREANDGVRVLQADLHSSEPAIATAASATAAIATAALSGPPPGVSLA